MISRPKRKAKSEAMPSPELIEQRRMQIRSHWTPTERRHRAEQAVERVRQLWNVIAEAEVIAVH
ncbi:MAG TPA: hypothetical protein VGJ16_10955 [Pirellulales bacterium]|jgi:hypothetical protein